MMFLLHSINCTKNIPKFEQEGNMNLSNIPGIIFYPLLKSLLQTQQTHYEHCMKLTITGRTPFRLSPGAN